MAYYKAPLYSLYALHWASAVVLVALSAQLIDWNWYRHDHKEMPILEELLVSAAMSIFWVIVSIATIEIGSGVVKWFSFEVLGAVWMWIMYLVGAAYFTGHEFASRSYCPRLQLQKDECNMFAAVEAFAWIQMAVLLGISILSILRLGTPRGGKEKVIAGRV